MKKFQYFQSPYLQEFRYSIPRTDRPIETNLYTGAAATDLKLKLRAVKPSSSFSGQRYESYLQTGPIPYKQQQGYTYSSKIGKQSHSQERLGQTDSHFRFEEQRGRGQSMKIAPSQVQTMLVEDDSASLRRRLEAKIEQLRRKSKSGTEKDNSINQTIKKESDRQLLDRLFKRFEAVLQQHWDRAEAWLKEKEGLEQQIKFLNDRLRKCT